MKLYDNLRAVLFPSGYKSGQIYPQKPLIWNNPAYWFSPGTIGNYCSTPNAAANQITGDIDIIAYVNLANLTGSKSIIAKWSGVNNSYMFEVFNAKLSFRTQYGQSLSTVDVPFSALVNYWVRVTRIASTGVVAFYTSANGTTWTQLGTNVAGTPGSLQNTSVAVTIGVLGDFSTFPMNGSIYRVLVSNAIGGNPVVDFNPNHFNWNSNMLQNGQTFTSRTTGEVWTINSTGASYIQPYLETIPFTRASAGTRQLPNGIIENLAANMPRLDSDLNGCPGILMEPQRTNVYSKSNDFSGMPGFWYDFSGASPTANQGISPDGTNNAWLFPSNTQITTQYGNNIAQTSGNQLTHSVFVKKVTSTTITLRIQQTSDNAYITTTVFNLDTMTVTSGVGVVENYGNGWYRLSITGVTLANNTSPRGFVTGLNGTCLMYGFQLEAANFASSYIPTTTATVTRSADAIQPASYQMMGLGGRGTIVIDYTVLGLPSSTGGGPFMLVDNATINTSRIYLFGEFSNGLRVWDYINGIYWYNATQTVGNRYKVLIKWDGRYGCCYVNGVKVFENFNLSPIYLNHIKLMQMVSASIRLNGFHTDNIAVSHADCVKLTS